MSGERVLLLARHGETDWNREGRWQGATDIPLNDMGRSQAEDLAERLRPLAPFRAWSSDLARARETAAIAAARLGLDEPEVHAGLRERAYGDFEGLSREECASRYPAAWEAWLSGGLPDPPGSEPRSSAAARVAQALDAIAVASADGGRPVLVVSHGGVIRSFLRFVLSLEASPVPNGGVWRVRWVDGAFAGAEELGRD